MVKMHPISKRMARPAFTIVELVFAIVIIGILAAVAIPRLAASRDDAEVAKGRSEVSSIRSSIALDRSQRLMSGDNTVRPALDAAAANANSGQALFGNVLEYPIPAGNGSGKWSKGAIGANTITYNFNLSGTLVSFDYNTTSGQFNCQTPTNDDCLLLTR